MNVTEPIWRSAAAWPDRVALIQNGESYSYAAFCHIVERVAARLAAAGLGRGECVALSIRNPLAFLSLMFAAARMGAVSTPAKSNSPASVRDALLARHRVKLLIQDEGDDWTSDLLPAKQHMRAQPFFAAWQAGEPRAIPPMARDVGQEPWFIALSSGTTGAPKSVPMTHARTILNSALGGRVGRDVHRVMVLADIAINMSISSCVRTLHRGHTLVMTSAGKSSQLLECVARDKPHQIVTTTAVATRLAAYSAREPGTLAKCASVDTLSVSGSKVPLSVQASLRIGICPNLEIPFGSTEAGAIALATADILAATPRCAGQLRPWVSAQAVDDAHRPLRPGEHGMLRFSSPTVVAGYLGDAEANEKAFRDGWFYTGDTGSVDAAGFLYLAGRADDLINIGGRKLDPTLIEQVLNEDPRIVESVVVAVPAPGRLARLHALVVAQETVAADELSRLCLERLGAAYVPERFSFARGLPRNDAGKVARSAVLGMLAAHARQP